MPRFALLFHDLPPGAARASHWDLLLEPPTTTAAEADAAAPLLWTWALAQNPLALCVSATADVTTLAQRLPDHRRLYLDFEGPLTGERGSVARQEQGQYELLEHTPARLTALLHGAQLRCQLVIDQPAAASTRVTFHHPPRAPA